MKIIELHKSVTASNDADAQALRERLSAEGKLLINIMSAAGSGKTTLLCRIITDLKDKVRIAVIEADIDASVDAERIEALGAKSIQAHTDGMCHMDAGMTAEAVAETGREDVDLLFLENVGNLICPAEFDTGAHLNVMLLSVPEGDDKPLKYPLMFQTSDALVITKTDALPYFDFDLEKCSARAKALNPKIRLFPVSAKTGEGMDALEAWICSEMLGLMRINSMSTGEAAVLLNTALEAGINMIDLADIYGGDGLCEKIVGDIFKEQPSLRDKFYVQTNCSRLSARQSRRE